MASTFSSVIITHTHLTTTTKVHHTRARRNPINYNLSDDDNGDVEDGDEEEGLQDTQNKLTGSWHEIHKIIDEKKDKYRILWAGVNPKTNRPWPADWVGSPPFSGKSSFL